LPPPSLLPPTVASTVLDDNVPPTGGHMLVLPMKHNS
jgi:hypothetical protein